MLQDRICKNALAKEKTYSLTDEKGLYLEISSNGSKYWRLSYRIGGKQKRIALGIYPEISLKQAREKREEFRGMIKNGIDPAIYKKQKKIEIKERESNQFKNIAMEWYYKHQDIWAKRTAFYNLSRLESNIFPYIGGISIKEITAKELLSVIRKIEERGSIVVAHKTLNLVGQIFRYAISIGKAEHNITADLKGALQPAKKKNYPYFSEKEFHLFLKEFSNLKCNIMTKLALKLLILTFVRSGELRGTRWEEFNFEKKEWRIPAERMKMREEHIVPLSEKTIEVLNQIPKIRNEKGLLFPCRTMDDKPISDNTLSKALRMQGYKGKATPHGMRATASTILNENGFKADVIERQLAHSERNSVRASYNHAEYLKERREMMEWWGKYVDKWINIDKHGLK